MNNRPKRRKHRDNPYVLEYIESKNLYYVSFIDGQKNLQKIEIKKEIFDLLDSYELEDLKELNEYDRHIEHSEVYDNNLNNRMLTKETPISELVERKIEIENLYIAIQKLPSTQKRRLKKYYFDHQTLREIASSEKCNYTAIKFSIDAAIRNLNKELKK